MHTPSLSSSHWVTSTCALRAATSDCASTTVDVHAAAPTASQLSARARPAVHAQLENAHAGDLTPPNEHANAVSPRIAQPSETRTRVSPETGPSGGSIARPFAQSRRTLKVASTSTSAVSPPSVERASARPTKMVSTAILSV